MKEPWAALEVAVGTGGETRGGAKAEAASMEFRLEALATQEFSLYADWGANTSSASREAGKEDECGPAHTKELGFPLGQGVP